MIWQVLITGIVEFSLKAEIQPLR